MSPEDICVNCWDERIAHVIVDYGVDVQGYHHTYLECAGKSPKECSCVQFIMLEV